ncbi:MAG: diguanylate cyclase [Comamonadaceae bacterium]|nr:diguanylate cyclase [Comamonadaceae bacterium]
MTSHTNQGIPWLQSLGTRAIVITLAVFVVNLWALSFYASRLLQADMQRVLGEQQFQAVSFVATEINDELTDRLVALEHIAKDMDERLISQPAALQATLEQRPILQLMFNGGIFATDANGTAIADVPLSTGRIGTNYIDRESVSVPLKTGKTVIGRPAMGKKLGAPIFSIVTPIRSTAGAVIGTLVATINLGKPNFLDKVTAGRYGKTGGYLLVAPQHDLFVTASDKSRIMQPLPTRGRNTLHDRYMLGFEGYGVAINVSGVAELSAAKAIPIAGWFIAVVLPAAEAFAPIHAMQQRMLWATLFLTLLTGALTWWLLQRQLAPMLGAANALTRLATENLPIKALPITRHDEIGAMLGGFNHLLETLRKREAALIDSEFRWKFATEGAGDGLWDWNVLAGTVYFSPRWKEMLGFSQDEIGSDLDEWRKRIHPDDLARVMADVQAHLDGLTPIYFNEHRLCCKDGHWKWILDRGLVVARDAAGKPLRAIGTHTDNTEPHQTDVERQAMQEKIRQLAFMDPLTQLPNRRLLDDRLGQAMVASKRSGQYGALMFLDLDNFKPLNDLHGHGVGDLLLVEVARRLTDSVRGADSVARLGGDEFVVVLNELDADLARAIEEARAVAEKIRLALAAPYRLTVSRPGEPVVLVEHRCSASIGVVMFVNHEETQTDLMKWADAAMYQAKDAGRNVVRFYASNGAVAPVDRA